MRHACSPHSGQHALGEREPIETRSWFDCSVTCSICSPSHKGRNNDTSILIHLVLQRVFLCRTMENVDSIQRKQAGTLHVGKSHFPLDVYTWVKTTCHCGLENYEPVPSPRTLKCH